LSKNQKLLPARAHSHGAPLARLLLSKFAALSPRPASAERFGAATSATGGLAGPARTHASKAGGEYRARTGDLLVANQALSQLS
jgi:hypothetical protein